MASPPLVHSGPGPCCPALSSLLFILSSFVRLPASGHPWRKRFYRALLLSSPVNCPAAQNSRCSLADRGSRTPTDVARQTRFPRQFSWEKRACRHSISLPNPHLVNIKASSNTKSPCFAFPVFALLLGSVVFSIDAACFAFFSSFIPLHRNIHDHIIALTNAQTSTSLGESSLEDSSRPFHLRCRPSIHQPREPCATHLSNLPAYSQHSHLLWHSKKPPSTPFRLNCTCGTNRDCATSSRLTPRTALHQHILLQAFCRHASCSS